MLRWMSVVLLLAISSTAAATINVVATTGSMGMLARVVGGDSVSITVLASPNRDARVLRARPTMHTLLHRADLLVSMGAGLESDWLPILLESANNPVINPGQPGFFEGAAHVRLLEMGRTAERSLDGASVTNPYVNLDPLRMAEIAKALAGHLGRMDSAQADVYAERARRFAEQVEARMTLWREQVAGAPGVLLYQRDADYLMQALQVPVLGYVNEDPDSPLTVDQLQALVDSLKDQRGVVLQANYQHDRGARFVARKLGWPHQSLPVEPTSRADADAWLLLIERWVNAVAGTVR